MLLIIRFVLNLIIKLYDVMRCKVCAILNENLKNVDLNDFVMNTDIVLSNILSIYLQAFLFILC